MASFPSKSKFYVFDAYGTLFDVHSAVNRHAKLVGPNAARVSEVWRHKQLEYSWNRAAMDMYQDFWALTGQALQFALKTVPESNLEAYDNLMEAYETLDCYPEVKSVLKALQDMGAKTAILSNGSPYMLERAVSSAGLNDVLDDLFSVDEVKTFKTLPATYSMVTNAYGCKPNEVAFQSSNRWDIAGATAFGFGCNWVNRTTQPDEYTDLAPNSVIADLTALTV